MITGSNTVAHLESSVKLEKGYGIDLRASPVILFQVSGSVLDHTGTPLPGASITEKGTSNGTQTDLDGHYTLEVSSSDAVLEIAYLGFRTQEVRVNGQTTITITLQEDNIDLDPVPW